MTRVKGVSVGFRLSCGPWCRLSYCTYVGARFWNGTGRDRGAKRGGAGKYNWGSEEGEARDGQNAERRNRRNNRSADAEKPATDGEDKPAEEGEVEKVEKVEEEEAAEPEPETITFEEARAAQAAAAPEGDKKVSRVVEIDDSLFKAAVVVTKEEDESDTYVIAGGAKKPKKKGAKNKKKVVSLDEFAKPASGNSRGGKGKGGKGGRGGKGGKGSRGGAFNLAKNDFPSLGGK